MVIQGSTSLILQPEKTRYLNQASQREAIFIPARQYLAGVIVGCKGH